MTFKPRWRVAGLIAAACLFGTGAAHADATIINPAGTVALGVKSSGALNTRVGSVAVNAGGVTGLAYKFPDGSFRDATAPGCLCEGWGVSATSGAGSFSGYDGNGLSNLTVGAFASTATTATTTASLTNLPGLSVQHAYAPADNAPGALFKSVVTITNSTGAALSDVRYVRVMDWDVPLTEFSEFVTIKGTATTTLLELSHNDGFDVASPLAATAGFAVTGCSAASMTTTDFEDCGPADHGAYFRFNFGTLDDGASYTFSIFYGAAGTEAAALAAIAAESIELYSLGQSNDGNNSQITGSPATFIFGFSGVGGVAQCGEPGQPPCPNGVPEPMSLALVGLGLAAMGALRRRRGTARAA